MSSSTTIVTKRICQEVVNLVELSQPLCLRVVLIYPMLTEMIAGTTLLTGNFIKLAEINY